MFMSSLTLLPALFLVVAEPRGLLEIESFDLTTVPGTVSSPTPRARAMVRPFDPVVRCRKINETWRFFTPLHDCQPAVPDGARTGVTLGLIHTF
jgi:hypothetical protein